MGRVQARARRSLAQRAVQLHLEEAQLLVDVESAVSEAIGNRTKGGQFLSPPEARELLRAPRRSGLTESSRLGVDTTSTAASAAARANSVGHVSQG